MPSESMNKRLKRLEQQMARVSTKIPKLYYIHVSRKVFDQAMAVGGPPRPSRSVAEFAPEPESRLEPSEMQLEPREAIESRTEAPTQKPLRSLAEVSDAEDHLVDWHGDRSQN